MNQILNTITQPGIIPLVGFALGLYVATSLVKFIGERAGGKINETISAYVSIIPVLIGMIAAPFVVPYLLSEFGSKGEVPVVASVFTGLTAGAISKVLWDMINKVIKRRLMRGKGEDPNSI